MKQHEKRPRSHHRPLSEMHREDALKRWPRLCAHLICHSLGYATPSKAASIVLAAARRQKRYCEWINGCYHGYMADYGLARRLVQEAIAHDDPCIFAS